MTKPGRAARMGKDTRQLGSGTYPLHDSSSESSSAFEIPACPAELPSCQICFCRDLGLAALPESNGTAKFFPCTRFYKLSGKPQLTSPIRGCVGTWGRLGEGDCPWC